MTVVECGTEREMKQCLLNLPSVFWAIGTYVPVGTVYMPSWAAQSSVAVQMDA